MGADLRDPHPGRRAAGAGLAGRTIVAVAVLFGLQLVVAGLYRFAAAFAVEDESGGTRVLLALLGVLSFIVGLYALHHSLVTVAALALLLGIFWIVNLTFQLRSVGRAAARVATAT